MPRNLNINLYLRPFSIAIYGKLSKLFFSVLFGGYKPCFEMKKFSKSSYICVFIFPKNSTIDSRKSSLTQKWLVVESCPNPHWIAFLMLYRLVSNKYPLSINYFWPEVPNYLMQNQMIEILRKSFLKVLVKYTLRIEVWLWKVLLSQHFQFKRFQDEKMESAYFPHADV